jgi:hypothetical protein
MHESVLVYRNLRYLKLASALVIAATVAYALHSPLGPPNGATWLGYTLGVVAAAIMIWLAWFGVQKRRYGKSKLPLQDWLSGHVYFGAALILIATLHAGFQIGPNIHTVLYVLTLIVIASGMVGVYFYVRYPRLLTENRRGLSSEVMLSQIADLDREIRQTAMALDDVTTGILRKAVQDTQIGGTLFQQIRGSFSNCPTTAARLHLENAGDTVEDSVRRQMLTRLLRKEDLLNRMRRDIKLRALLRVWLYVHIPFSVAALVALLTHVITVFYYW